MKLVNHQLTVYGGNITAAVLSGTEKTGDRAVGGAEEGSPPLLRLGLLVDRKTLPSYTSTASWWRGGAATRGNLMHDRGPLVRLENRAPGRKSRSTSKARRFDVTTGISTGLP